MKAAISKIDGGISPFACNKDGAPVCEGIQLIVHHAHRQRFGGRCIRTGIGLLPLLLSGCLAQQADLTQVERNLGTKIAKLDQREKELQQTIGQKEKELQQAITKAKGDLDRMVGETRARLSQQLTELREADLPSMQGGLDQTAHQINLLRHRLDDVEHQSKAGLEAKSGVDSAAKRLAALEKGQADQAAALRAERDRLQDELGKVLARLDSMNNTVNSTMSAMAKTLGGKLDDHEKRIDTADSKATSLGQQLEAHNAVLTEQMAQYAKSLSEFKKALTGLGEKLAQEDQRYQDLSAKVLGRSDALSAKVEADAKATSTHLNEVNKSVGSVAKALETMGGQVMSRVEEQDRRLDDMGKGLHSMDAQVAALNQTIAQLRSERDAQVAALAQTIAQLQKERDGHINTLNQAIAQVNTLNQAIAQLRGERESQVSAIHETIAQVRAERDAKVSALNETIAQVRAERDAKGNAFNDTVAQVQADRQNTKTKDDSLSTVPARREPETGQETSVASVPNSQTSAVQAEASQGVQGRDSMESPAQIKDAYERNIATFRQGNLDAAAQGFSQFLTRYPKSDLAPNAQYWLGECYYGKRDYARAIEAFDRVKLIYPTSDKVPAALLKKGFAYLALKDPHRASSVWRQVVDGYPKSPEANKALEKLAQLKQMR
jgi:tol-pal system protein YbgF